MSLKEAHKRRDEAKELLAAGVDPGANRKAVKAANVAEKQNSFEVVAREWHERQKILWVKSHGDKILARFEKDIFPLIGKKAVQEISAPELLMVLRRIESRGAIETAYLPCKTVGKYFVTPLPQGVPNETLWLI